MLKNAMVKSQGSLINKQLFSIVNVCDRAVLAVFLKEFRDEFLLEDSCVGFPYQFVLDGRYVCPSAN